MSEVIYIIGGYNTTEAFLYGLAVGLFAFWFLYALYGLIVEMFMKKKSRDSEGKKLTKNPETVIISAPELEKNE